METYKNLLETYENLLETYWKLMETYWKLMETYENLFETYKNLWKLIGNLLKTYWKLKNLLQTYNLVSQWRSPVFYLKKPKCRWPYCYGKGKVVGTLAAKRAGVLSLCCLMIDWGWHQSSGPFIQVIVRRFAWTRAKLRKLAQTRVNLRRLA